MKYKGYSALAIFLTVIGCGGGGSTPSASAPVAASSSGSGSAASSSGGGSAASSSGGGDSMKSPAPPPDTLIQRLTDSNTPLEFSTFSTRISATTGKTRF